MESEELLSSDDDELGFGARGLLATFSFFFSPPSAETFFAGGGDEVGEGVGTFFLSEVAGTTFAGADTGMCGFVTGLPFGELVAESPSLGLAAGLPCSGEVTGLPLKLVELEADLLAAEGEVFLPRASLKEAAVGEVGVEGEFTLKWGTLLFSFSPSDLVGEVVIAAWAIC